MKLHPLREIIHRRHENTKIGIASYCTANELVLEAILERARDKKEYVLIEATANQVNQYGGYTGMKPHDFAEFVYSIARRVRCPENLIILGGDHLGPLTWCKDTEEIAMEKANKLVYEYVKAGFTKIHLDTSMRLTGDAMDTPLSTDTIARRGICLYQTAMDAYKELEAENPDAIRPVFVIGSEVPIPGGAQEIEEGISVTKPKSFVTTVDTYQRIFAEQGLENAWSDIIAVVVQPGVEFGDGQIFLYDPKAAESLCDELKNYPEIVFEGHSTDYQSAECLKQMVNDGIAILKVGPALTFGLRESLFALNMIEQATVGISKQSHLIEVIEEEMLEHPENWEKHYHGSAKDQAFARKYSFSDRSRYYMGIPKIVDAMNKMFANLSEQPVSLSILHQFMPIQYDKVRDGQLSSDPRTLAKAGVVRVLEDYEYAVKGC